jgi:glycerol-3-phosphate dehydrogenase
VNTENQINAFEMLQLRRMEPNVTPEATAALFASSAGIVIPFEFAIALAEVSTFSGVKYLMILATTH